MWKPYNCSVAQKEELVNLVRKAFLCLSKIHLKDLLEYIRSAITIVAFLLAVDYFAAKPSVRIVIHPMPKGYYMDSLLRYYQANNLDFPKQLMEDQSLRKIFARDTRLLDPNYVLIWSGMSDEELIRAIVRGQQEVGGWVKYMIEQLEKQIGKYTYFKHAYAYMDERGYHDEQQFRPILDYIRSKLSTTDYYIFLTALIYSREVDHVIYITNDGDLDLKNVRITFPAPLSKITNSRANNILSCRPSTSLLHQIVDGTSETTLRLPWLKKGEGATLNIRAREHEINRNEVFTSYERDNLIDRGRAFLYFFLILIITFALSLVLRGSK